MIYWDKILMHWDHESRHYCPEYMIHNISCTGMFPKDGTVVL